MVREREDLENEQIKGKRGGGKGLQSRGRLQLNFESPICVQEKRQSELASVSTAVKTRLWKPVWKQLSQVREFALNVLLFVITVPPLYPGKSL